jgi:hypothetical protein
MAEHEPTLVTLDDLGDFGTAKGKTIVEELRGQMALMNLDLALLWAHALAGLDVDRCDIEVDAIIARIERAISTSMKFLKRPIEEAEKEEETKDDAE